MTTKYLDLAGLAYFKQKCDAKYVTNADIQSAINTALGSYQQGIVTIVASLESVSSPSEGILYLVPDTNATTSDVYTIWAWETVSGTAQWVQMGATTFTLTTDATVIQNSTNPVQGGAVYTELGLKLDASELTSSITNGGTNAVTSGAIYTALDAKVNTADLVSVSNAEVDAMFMGSNEIWIDGTSWATMNVLYDTNSQTAPGLALSKNSHGYYVFDVSGLTTVDTLVFSDDDGTNVTLQITTTLSGVQAYGGKIISVTAGSSDVTVVA